MRSPFARIAGCIKRDKSKRQCRVVYRVGSLFCSLPVLILEKATDPQNTQNLSRAMIKKTEI
jgi:hypothetical protein